MVSKTLPALCLRAALGTHLVNMAAITYLTKASPQAIVWGMPKNARSRKIEFKALGRSRHAYDWADQHLRNHGVSNLMKRRVGYL